MSLSCLMGDDNWALTAIRLEKDKETFQIRVLFSTAVPGHRT